MDREGTKDTEDTKHHALPREQHRPDVGAGWLRGLRDLGPFVVKTRTMVAW